MFWGAAPTRDMETGGGEQWETRQDTDSDQSRTRRARRAQPSDAAPAGRPDTFLLIGAWVVTFLDQAPRQSDHGAAHWKAL